MTVRASIGHCCEETSASSSFSDNAKDFAEVFNLDMNCAEETEELAVSDGPKHTEQGFERQSRSASKISHGSDDRSRERSRHTQVDRKQSEEK